MTCNTPPSPCIQALRNGNEELKKLLHELQGQAQQGQMVEALEEEVIGLLETIQVRGCTGAWVMCDV